METMLYMGTWLHFLLLFMSKPPQYMCVSKEAVYDNFKDLFTYLHVNCNMNHSAYIICVSSRTRRQPILNHVAHLLRTYQTVHTKDTEYGS